MRASRWAVDGRCLDARNDQWCLRIVALLGDRVPCWHGAPGRRSVPTVLPCPGPAVPPSCARYWPRSRWSPRSASWPPRPTARRGSPSRSACSSSLATTGLSVLVTRRREGAVVGVLLGLLSLAVALVVAKEIWLQWLATTDDPGRWAWLVAVSAENAWWILATFGLLLLHFPDGRVPSPRWRWVPVTMVVDDGGHPGRRCGGRRAVPRTAGGPGPAVRPAPGVVGAALPGRVRGAAPAHRCLRGVPGAAVPACRPHPAPADQVAGPGRDRHAALPPALPARDRDLGPAVVDQRHHRARLARRHPGGCGDSGAQARPVRRRQGPGGRRHLGAGDRAAAGRLRGRLVGRRCAGRPRLRDRRRDRNRGRRRCSCCPLCASCGERSTPGCTRCAGPLSPRSTSCTGR